MVRKKLPVLIVHKTEPLTGQGKIPTPHYIFTSSTPLCHFSHNTLPSKTADSLNDNGEGRTVCRVIQIVSMITGVKAAQFAECL